MVCFFHSPRHVGQIIARLQCLKVQQNAFNIISFYQRQEIVLAVRIRRFRAHTRSSKRKALISRASLKFLRKKSSGMRRRKGGREGFHADIRLGLEK